MQPYTCTHVHTHVHTHKDTHMHACTKMCAHTHAHRLTHTDTHKHTNTDTYTHMHTHTHPHPHPHTPGSTLNRGERRPQAHNGLNTVGNEVCHWGRVQDRVEGHPHPLSVEERKVPCNIERERENYVNMEFPSTTSSGCQR